MFSCVSKYNSLSPPVLLSPHLRIFVVSLFNKSALLALGRGEAPAAAAWRILQKRHQRPKIVTLSQSINMQGGAREASATCPVGQKNINGGSFPQFGPTQ
jgi:hypothetical protein